MKFSTNALLLVSSFESAQADIWRKGMNPGMMLRVDELSINAMRSVIQRYVSKELYETPYDLLPHKYRYNYKSRIPGMSWELILDDIKYSDLDLNLEDIKFDLTRMDGTWGEIKMDVPSLKYWAIDAT